MTSKRHQDAIDRVAPGLPRKGFPQALRTLLGIEMDSDQRVIPDAFRIDTETRLVTVIEVEAAHPTTERKLQRLRSLRASLQTIGWALRLEMAASSSHRTTDIDIDTGQLSDEAFKELQESDSFR